MTRKVYHVTKTDSGWKGKAQGGQRSSSVGNTKSEVMKETIRIAKNQGNSQVIIHKDNGRFQEERTYPRSSDPRSSKG
uniref:DUF2188 domain-containing protein n=1 Tax=Microscilla sp. PRE1 TaxID=155537 RepID=UPI00146A2E52|nr:DUF2188 domain-containing protein [Microscilla sp. PRE1]